MHSTSSRTCAGRMRLQLSPRWATRLASRVAFVGTRREPQTASVLVSAAPLIVDDATRGEARHRRRGSRSLRSPPGGCLWHQIHDAGPLEFLSVGLVAHGDAPGDRGGSAQPFEVAVGQLGLGEASRSECVHDRLKDSRHCGARRRRYDTRWADQLRWLIKNKAGPLARRVC
jgi:hypothetical protein